MQRLLLCAAFLGAATAYIAPSYAGSGSSVKSSTILPEVNPLYQTEVDVKILDDSETSSTASSTSSSSSTSESSSSSSTSSPGIIQGIVSELPVTLPPILEELDNPKRRVITYDQRQEGQYNIRADLDNFMIVLIPPSTSDGLSLLDLLTKSNLRKTSHSSSKNKKKHYSSSLGIKPESGYKFRQFAKSPEYFAPQQDQMEAAASSRVGEFIEGRTPYHVDISSLHGADSEGPQARLNPDRQVDVLPPPYPLAYQHLMKPYLEADSTIIQTLPPAELASHQSADAPQNSGFYRFARYIRGDNFLDTNRVTTSNRLGSPQAQASNRRISEIPVFRPDLDMGASKLYPPLDIPNFTLTSSGRSLNVKKSSSTPEGVTKGKQSLDDSDSGEDVSYDDVNMPSVQIRPLEDDLELELHTDDLIDEEAKALLRDGIERCAPGKRRDSYGVCREIEGY